jgi:hypothetical protein
VNPTAGDAYTIYSDGKPPTLNSRQIKVAPPGTTATFDKFSPGDTYYFSVIVTRGGVQSAMSAPISVVAQ